METAESKFIEKCSVEKNQMDEIIGLLPFREWNLYEINSVCGKLKDEYGLFNVIEHQIDMKSESKPNLVVMAGFSLKSFCGTSQIIMNPASIAELSKKYRAIYIINYDQEVFRPASNDSSKEDKERQAKNKDDFEKDQHSYESRLKYNVTELQMLDKFGIAIDKILRCPQLALKNVHLLGKSLGAGLALHTVSKSDIYTALFLAVPANSTYLWPLDRLSDEKLKSLTIKCGWNKNDTNILYGIKSCDNPPLFRESIRALAEKRKMPEVFGNYREYEFNDGNKHEVNPDFVKLIVND